MTQDIAYLGEYSGDTFLKICFSLVNWILPIDFIFVNDQISEVLKYRIVRDTYNGKHSSDHYPIYTDIKF